MSFLKRIIDVSFTLAPTTSEKGESVSPKFQGSGGANTVKITGKRVNASITNSGQITTSQLQMSIYGMSLSQMNQLSTVSTWGKLVTQISQNTVTIASGDEENGTATVFTGRITDAMIDFTNAPDVAFQVSAYSAADLRLTPGKATSFNGVVPVETILQDICGRCGLVLVNNGVQAKLAYQYLFGTYLDQIDECCRNVNIDHDIQGNVLSIWPKGGSRKGVTQLVSPETGMVGYPTFFPLGINVVTEHRHGINYGSQIEVHSSVQPACGTWVVFCANHDITSELPGGSWFTRLQCSRPGAFPVSGF